MPLDYQEEQQLVLGIFDDTKYFLHHNYLFLYHLTEIDRVKTVCPFPVHMMEYIYYNLVKSEIHHQLELLYLSLIHI